MAKEGGWRTSRKSTHPHPPLVNGEAVRARAPLAAAAARVKWRLLRRTPAPQPPSPLLQVVHEAVTGDSSATPHPQLFYLSLCTPSHETLFASQCSSAAVSSQDTFAALRHSARGQLYCVRAAIDNSNSDFGEVSFGFVRRQQLTSTSASHFAALLKGRNF